MGMPRDELVLSIITAPFLVFSFLGVGILLVLSATLFPLPSLVKKLFRNKGTVPRHQPIGGRH